MHASTSSCGMHLARIIFLGLTLFLNNFVFSHLVTIGLQGIFSSSEVSGNVGFSGSDSGACVASWQHLRTAQAAVATINAADWWKSLGGVTLALEPLSYGTPYEAWRSAETFVGSGQTSSAPPSLSCNSSIIGKACKVLRVGIVGPASSDASQLVELVTRAVNLPHISFAATASSLTQSTSLPLDRSTRQPFFRMNYVDEMIAGAIFSFITHIGWQRFAIIHVRSAYGTSSVTVMEELAHRSSSSGNEMEISSIVSFESAFSSSSSTTSTTTSDVSTATIATIDSALQTLSDGTSRIVVLFAYSADASIVLNRASAMGMVGKGWTWLGGEWVREATWSLPVPVTAAAPSSSSSSHHRLLTNTEVITNSADGYDEGAVAAARNIVSHAMQGVVGVVATPITSTADLKNAGLVFTASSPSTTTASTTAFTLAVAREAEALSATPLIRVSDAAAGASSISPPPTLIQSQCPAMFHPPLTTTGLRNMDEFSPYVYDAIWALADAVASTLVDLGAGGGGGRGGGSASTSTASSLQNEAAFASLTPSKVADRMQATLAATRPSPLTNRLATWLANGDRYNLPLLLVNIRGGDVVVVGTWASAVQPLPMGETDGEAGIGIIAQGFRHRDGSWVGPDGSSSNLGTIIWSSGTSVIPIDRTEHTDHSRSTSLMVALCGMIASLIIGAMFHKFHITIIPESAGVVIVGVIFGIIIRVGTSREVQAAAAFNGEFFMLVLLPIIIFESGFSLDRKPFFTQFFSINAFAIFGTLISTIVIGMIVYATGTAGITGINLSFEESMAFASLLSATDPVATLAVFGALQVDPMLNGLVFGESVINDAVSIVLYRTFASFLVTEITASAALSAVGAFVSILTFSVLIGILVGFATTLVFRLINLTGILPADAAKEGLATVLGRLSSLKHAMGAGRSGTGLPGIRFPASLRKKKKTTNEQQQQQQQQQKKDDEAAANGKGVAASASFAVPTGATTTASNRTTSSTSPASFSHHATSVSVRLEATASGINDDAVAGTGTGGGGGEGDTAKGLDAGQHRRRSIENAQLRSSSPRGKVHSNTENMDEEDEERFSEGYMDDDDVNMSQIDDGGGEGGGITTAEVMAGIAETALLLMFAYLSFALAEAITLSGIVSSLFCGIIMNLYTRRIMSLPGRHVASGVFKMLATLADTSIFFQIGLNVILILGNGSFYAMFIFMTLLGCLIGRAANVFPISLFLNIGRIEKISLKFQTQMWWAGLRGAIAFASALSFPTQNRSTIVNATTWICMFTIFAMGSTTTPLLKRLQIPYGVSQSRAEVAAQVKFDVNHSLLKKWMAKADSLIQRIIYGKTVLALMHKHKDEMMIVLSPPRKGGGNGSSAAVFSTPNGNNAAAAATTTPRRRIRTGGSIVSRHGSLERRSRSSSRSASNSRRSSITGVPMSPNAVSDGAAGGGGVGFGITTGRSHSNIALSNLGSIDEAVVDHQTPAISPLPVNPEEVIPVLDLENGPTSRKTIVIRQQSDTARLHDETQQQQQTLAWQIEGDVYSSSSSSSSNEAGVTFAASSHTPTATATTPLALSGTDEVSLSSSSSVNNVNEWT